MTKREFTKTYLVYLGHVIGGGKLIVDPSKVDYIVNWPRPKTVTEVRSFLGAFQYWRKFIAGFSSIPTPLYTLKSVKKYFQWGGKQHKSFNNLKERINTTPVLVFPYLQQPFEIKTNASGFSMAFVLMQG